MSVDAPESLNVALYVRDALGIVSDSGDVDSPPGRCEAIDLAAASPEPERREHWLRWWRELLLQQYATGDYPTPSLGEWLDRYGDTLPLATRRRVERALEHSRLEDVPPARSFPRHGSPPCWVPCRMDDAKLNEPALQLWREGAKWFFARRTAWLGAGSGAAGSTAARVASQVAGSGSCETGLRARLCIVFVAGTWSYTSAAGVLFCSPGFAERKRDFEDAVRRTLQPAR